MMTKNRHLVMIGAAACLLAGGVSAQPAADTLPLNFVRAAKPVVIDGKLDDWTLTAPVTYEVDAAAADRTVQTHAMWDDQNLYLAYQVHDASPMKNAGSDPSSAFKTGDALHFYLSTDPEVTAKQGEGGPRDFHVLMAMQQGKPVIFAYRQQKAGTDKPTLISSPATKIEMAWMGPVPGAELAVQLSPDRKGQGYTAEIKLPLAFFDDFKPAADRKIGVDVAVDFSDSAGTKNLAKVWWSRGASQILDIPTELRFERNLWGQGLFRAAGQLPLVTDNSHFYVVPAPGAVTVDGDLADWDLSCAYGPHYVDAQLKDKFNVTWAAMYDAQALYLGAVFNAGGKFENDGGVNNVWWQGDSLEFRLVADPKNQDSDVRTNQDLLTFGIWYNPQEKKDYVTLQRSFKFEIGDTTAITVKSRATEGGRTFEVRVPWSTVKSGSFPKAGDGIAWTMAAIWKNGLRAYGMGSISSFRGIGDWGQASFLPTGKQPLAYLNLRRPLETALAEEAKYKITLEVPEKGLLSAGVYTADGRLLRTLLAGREAGVGKLTVPWNGNTDLNEPAPAGTYQVRAVLNAGLAAQYVTTATSPGKPAHASENPKGGWGGVWGNIIDIAADAKGVYPLWAMEEGDGALLQVDEEGNLQWRQHIPLALGGPQVAVATNGSYVFVGVDTAGKNAGKAGLWRVRCEDGAYVPFAHEGSDPLEFYLEGVTRPVAEKGQEKAANIPPAISSLAADAKTLYVSAWHQNKVKGFDAETGKPGKSFDIEKPLGLCLDGKGGLLIVSGTRVLRLDLASGQITPVISAGLEAPHDVACDKDGSLLVTDRGQSQQLKRFDAQGKLLTAFGVAGGRDNHGQYLVDHLRDPAGVAVAASGKVFFSEDAAPRVFVRLSPELKYEKLWAGPWYISGEVCVDPYEPEHLYTHCGEFIRHHIDYQNKTSTPDAVWTRFATPGTAGDEWWSTYGRWFPRILRHQGVTYMLCGGPVVSLFRIDGYQATLMASIGVDRDKTGWTDKWIFCDLNANGKVDTGERVVTPQDPKAPTAFTPSYWGGSIDERDLTLYLLDGRGTAVLALTPTFPQKGVPVYRFDTARRIPLDAARKPGQQANLSSIWCTPDGGVFGNADANGSDPRGIGHSSHLSDVYVYRLDRDGKLLWRAGRKASGIAKNGEFYGRACGLGGPLAGKYFSFVDENGQDKVYTDDGLFVGNLLSDSATATPSELTLLVEHFSSSVYQNAKDQKWYFTAGAGGYASIWEIVGLDTIKRLTAQVEVK